MRKLASERIIYETWRGPQGVGALPSGDVCKLADAYLTEHPEDEDEPITKEWLDTVLPVKFGYQSELYVEVYPTNVTLSLDTQTDHSLPLPQIRTRGQLRQLIKLLKGE